MATAAEDLVAVVRLLVDDPKGVSATEAVLAGDAVELQLSVASEDRGKVIGRHGRTIDALRELAQVRGERDGRSYAVEIVED